MRDAQNEDTGEVDAWERRQSQAIKDLAKRNALAKKLNIPTWLEFQGKYGLLLNVPPIRMANVYELVCALMIVAELKGRQRDG